ncbi:hypothetical protein WA538_001124 [Blastocystis sp. DL]
MFSAILAAAGVILSIFLVCVIVTVIKKVSTPSTIDEELEEYERLLKEREKRGTEAMTSTNQQPSAPVPILSEQEAAAISIPIADDQESHSSEEDLLQETHNSDNTL